MRYLVLILVVATGCVTTKQSMDMRVEIPAEGKPQVVIAYRLE